MRTNILQAGGAQALDAVAGQGTLPGKKFLNRQTVALAGIIKRNQAAAHRRDNFSLAPGYPAAGIGGRKICNGKGTAIRANDKFGARSELIGHDTHYTQLGPTTRYCQAL